MNLAAIVRILVRSLLCAAGMDVLPDPHPAESIAALDADAAVGRLMDEVADGADDLSFVVIDPHELCAV
jgi:hypothetical protein